MLGKLTPVIAAVALAFPQAPLEPDFSGEWKLVSSEPAGVDAPLSITIQQPIKRANIHGKPVPPFYSELLVTRDSGSGPRTERHSIGSRGGTVGPTTRTEYGASWEGRALVLENSRYVGSESTWREWDKRREAW